MSDDLANYVAERSRKDPEFPSALGRAQQARDVLDALVTARKQAGLTQVAVAKRMGVRQPTVSGFEAGSDPTLSTLQRYAEAVGVELNITVTATEDGMSDLVSELFEAIKSAVAEVPNHAPPAPPATCIVYDPAPDGDDLCPTHGKHWKQCNCYEY